MIDAIGVNSMAEFSDFQKIDIRVGKVVSVEEGRCILVAPDREAPLGARMF